MSDTRAALEAALVASPDDTALHAAYADLLIEHGDPRGEYVRLQLALEDTNQPADRLRDLAQRAFELRREHEPDWLGPLHPFVSPPQRTGSVGEMVAENVTVTWRRGWVFAVEVPRLTREGADALVACPAARLLRRLTARRGSASRLANAPWVPVLQRLDLGTLDFDPRPVEDFQRVARLVRRARRLRRLAIRGTILTELAGVFHHGPRLRSLTVETFGRIPVGILSYNPRIASLRRLHLDNAVPHPDPDFPRGRINEADELAMLFGSKHLGSLRHLALRLRQFGDAGVEELVRSGLIRRLRGLDLCRCDITDDGADRLAACPDVPKLEYLHLDNNYLTAAGIGALADVGVTVSDRQAFGPFGGMEDEIPW